MQIYLDYSATTPQRQEVTEKVQQVATSQWGNSSSLHIWGERAAFLLEEARFKVSRLINAPDPNTITFTSGGTEANNLAIFGITRQYRQPQHLIISEVEHSAIAEPVKFLEQQGWQVTRLGVNPQGRVNPEDLQASIQSNTVLISMIYGQSEVGTLQPIERLARIACDRGVLFHTDAVQVAGRLPLDVQQLGADLLSLSSHKLYGPQGMGALYVRRGVKLFPLLMGGGQEGGLRSGTQAIAPIAGFGVAAELALQNLELERSRLRELRDLLFESLADCPYLVPTGDRLHRLPHHVSFCLTSPLAGEVTGKAIVRQMNLAGIAISAGSACHSGKLSPSPILKAMGYDDAMALAGIRFSLGKDTTQADIEWTAMVLKQVLGRFLAKMTVLR
ncbi:MAG: cysteine desulfurase family protein [Cyanobacteria bacterium P01_E01_bin.42]